IRLALPFFLLPWMSRPETAHMTAVPEIASQPAPRTSAAAASIGMASQRQLIWLKFREHRLAYWGGIVILLIYLVGIFAEFVAPPRPDFYDPAYTMLAPQGIKLFYADEAGAYRFQPHVTGFSSKRDPKTLRRVFAPDPDIRIPIGLFVRGEPYKLWGLIPS